jgi:hypothetical protein
MHIANKMVNEMNEQMLRRIIRDELTALVVPQLLTPEEASEVLKVRVVTMANWRTQGCGPTYIRAEGKVLYALADLHLYLSERKTST